MDLRAVSRAGGRTGGRAVILLLVLAACATGQPPTPEEAGSANPFVGDTAAAKAGVALFSSMNCDGCHGGGGLGFVGPNLVDGRWRFGGSDAAVFQSIHSGRPQGMPAYGALLDDATIWQLVTYLKSQPVPEDIATEAWP